MSVTASMRWVASLILYSSAVACAACATGAPDPSTRPRGNTAEPSQAGSGNAGSAPAGSSSDGWTSRPDIMIPIATAGTNVSVGGAGGTPVAGAGGSTDSAECLPGQFCPNTDLDPTDCGKLELETDVKTVLKPGNVLVVFDRSGSMTEKWNDQPKYQAAGNALVAAIEPLKANLTVGGVFFPSPSPSVVDPDCPQGCNAVDLAHWIPGPGGCCLKTAIAGACGVNSIDQPDQLDFAPANSFIAGLPLQWQLPGAGGTPLEAGITRAAEAVQQRKFTEPLVVIIMTDGEPTCGTDEQRVLDQISAWKTAAIPTYVIGLPGAQDAADLLKRMALAGGTDNYIDPMNPQELEQRLRAVISSTVRAGFDSCTFRLSPKAEVPEKLHLIVKMNGKESDVPRALSQDASWTVNAAGDQVELQGGLCDLAKNGSFEGLRFVFGCVDVPPYVPPVIN